MATMVSGQLVHDMLAVPDQDDLARQLFVQSFMTELSGRVQPGNRMVFEGRIGPAFMRTHGRPIGDVNELRKAMMRDPFTQMWSSLKRCAKEMQYESVGPSVERQLPELIARAKEFRESNGKLGSLALDPDVECPRYNAAVEIHCKPGGYHTDLAPDDVFAGAEYDRTYFMITNGGVGPTCAGLGADVADWVKQTYPQFKPRTILDIGCTIGHSTTPLCDAFPDAVVYGIDVGAPCLRYGHARAEALGKKVHFSQQNAEHTSFADGSFDLVVSCLVLHELSNQALRNVLKESHRLLAKGGVMAHMDSPQNNQLDLIDQFIPGDWDTHYNAEPFLTTLNHLDLVKLSAAAGFGRSKVKQDSFASRGPSIGTVARRRDSSAPRNRFVISAVR
ncbi:MAG: class I SAM-dependent methyltransferase [Alphaproteobacteria bacterium]|nr:class I SAM-dependent methyltransferase [Alphaproteobacteria bacterium]